MGSVASTCYMKLPLSSKARHPDSIMSDPGDVNRFYCHCCRDSFLKPICPPADNRFTKILGAGILLAAMFAGGGVDSFYIGGIILFGLSGLAMFWGAEIRSRLPSVCPVCRSTNFSRQPKAADEKK